MCNDQTDHFLAYKMWCTLYYSNWLHIAHVLWWIYIEGKKRRKLSDLTIVFLNYILFCTHLYVIRAFFPIWSNVFHSGDGKITPENDVSSINCSDTVIKMQMSGKYLMPAPGIIQNCMWPCVKYSLKVMIIERHWTNKEAQISFPLK